VCDAAIAACAVPRESASDPKASAPEGEPTNEGVARSGPPRVDLLLVIDNSIYMGDKQALFAEAAPELVQAFAAYDLHVGIITSSLGGYGSDTDCTDASIGQMDNAHLLGSLPRVQEALPGTPEFLSWCPVGSASDCVPSAGIGSNASALGEVLQDQVRETRERGCGWESTLESWVRFLVDPHPWSRLVRQNCPFGGDTNQLCIGPEMDGNGLPFVDQAILDQRARFLRPDSILGIVMLTDENDCSFTASGQSWRLAQTYTVDASGFRGTNRAYKGNAVCAQDPNDPCCFSCGSGWRQDCPTSMDELGNTVAAGCEEPQYKSIDDLAQEGSDQPSLDAINLRCFDQKRRFGVDELYPVERYSNALFLDEICVPSETLVDPDQNGMSPCLDNPDAVVSNPLYSDLTHPARLVADPAALPIAPRSQSDIFLAGIVGVPSQAVSTPMDWMRVLGSAYVGAPYDLQNSPPLDPHLWEQIDPRPGVDPAVNGGDWNILDRDELQYACTYPLEEPRDCPSLEVLEFGESVSCDCTWYGGDDYANPICDGLTQTHGRAHPSIRPLQVLRDFGDNSIVASICPSNTSDPAAPDYGYRPAVNAIAARILAALDAP
jgi:hypothetical protein